MADLFFLFLVFGTEYLAYCWHNDYERFVRNVCSRAVNVNIVFAKVFQAFIVKYAPKAIDVTHNITPSAEGTTPHVVGLDVQPHHVGSGMVSLVYAGRYNDLDVVVKVLRPGIRDQIVQGVNSLQQLFLWLEVLPPLRKYDLLIVLTQVQGMLLDQLDFRKEVQNQETFRKNFAYHSKVVVPVVHCFDDHYIVMERFRASEQLLLSERDRYAALICEITLKSAIIDGFVHADMHSGNLFFLPEGKLGVIDFGLVFTLTVPQRNDYFELCVAINSSDYDKAADISLHRYSYVRKAALVVDQEKALAELRDLYLVSDQVTKSFGVSEISLMISRVHKCGYAITPYFYQVMMSMVASDTLVRTLCPSFHILLRQSIRNLVASLSEEES